MPGFNRWLTPRIDLYRFDRQQGFEGGFKARQFVERCADQSEKTFVAQPGLDYEASQTGVRR